MTTELTHEQAFIARLMLEDDARLRVRMNHIRSGGALVLGENSFLTRGNAEELLAAYNAKYRTVEVEALSALVEFAEGELKATDETFAGYPEKLARFDYLRDAIAKVKEVLR